MNDDTPKQPEHEEDGQGTDQTPDRTQPELTEQGLLVEERDEADPEQRRKIEGELEGMTSDLEDAKSK